MAPPLTGKSLIAHPPTQVKLVAVEDRKLRFKVECRDEKEIIDTGFH
jgi:hypothetical protein